MGWVDLESVPVAPGLYNSAPADDDLVISGDVGTLVDLLQPVSDTCWGIGRPLLFIRVLQWLRFGHLGPLAERRKRVLNFASGTSFALRVNVLSTPPDFLVRLHEFVLSTVKLRSASADQCRPNFG